jgi:hypothetical protein
VALSGVYVAIVGVLVAGGALKAARPADTANALSALGVPVGRWVVRAGGGAEAVLGIWALAVGGWLPALLVGVSYLAFGAFVGVALLRRAPISSCGCFGGIDTPPSVLHLLVNLLAASAALVVAADGGPSLATILTGQPELGVPLLVLSAVTAYLVFLALALLPRLFGTGRRVQRRGSGPALVGRA